MFRKLKIGVFISIFFGASLSVFATDDPCTDAARKLARDHSMSDGLVQHGEHWVDLLLTLKGSRHLTAFEAMTRGLIAQIRQGRMTEINEKIDGSMSVGVGFNSEAAAFIAYKKQLDDPPLNPRRPVVQLLMSSPAQAEEVYASKPHLAKFFREATQFLTPAMRALHEKYKDLVVQGDVLFAPGGDRIQRGDDEMIIKANHIAYRIPRGHSYFERLQKAEIGIVFHSGGTRELDPSGRVLVRGAADPKRIREFVEDLQRASDKIFVLHPWSFDVQLERAGEFGEPQETAVDQSIAKVKENMASLTEEFKSEWNSKFEAEFRVFFNSHVRPPRDGGIYLAAKNGEAFDRKKWLDDFEAFSLSRRSRSPVFERLRTSWTEFRKTHEAEVVALMEAYYEGIRIQYILKPFVPEIFKSKLGGGEVEGVMLKTQDTLVKWVDRLGFTMGNNALWNRGVEPDVLFKDLPPPLNHWHPKAAFIPLKGQPVHPGHIAMIRKAAEDQGFKNVFVIVSEKEADLKAKDWKAVGAHAQNTKKNLEARDYQYVLDVPLKLRLLKAGLRGTRAKVFAVSTRDFWDRYLKLARDAGLEGSITVVVGEKEVGDERYEEALKFFPEHLNILSIPPQEGGVSGTDVRGWLRTYAISEVEAEKAEALQKLNGAFSYIEAEKTRQSLIDSMAKRWKRVDRVVQSLLKKSEKEKAQKKKAKKK